MEPEPQKNGKTINWCTVDVGDANGTGEPQGIVCGAHNFAAGDLVVVVLPGGVLPGGFEISARKTYGHVSAGMICSATRARPRRRPRRHHRAARRRRRARRRRVRRCCGLRDEVIEFEINPDRAYALSLRGVAREAALGLRRAVPRPGRPRDVPAPNDDGYPVVVEDPDGCPVFVARTVTGFDPAAPDARLDGAPASQLAGMRPISLAVDVTNYVMLELGQPIHGYDGDKLPGPIVVRRATRGRAADHPRRRRPRRCRPRTCSITDDSGPIGLGRRDGRRDHRDVGDHDDTS